MADRNVYPTVVYHKDQPVSRDPWTSIACFWQGHPDAAEFEQNLKNYRQEVDRDSQRP